MAGIIKSCMQFTLKSVNLIMAMVGIAMILYGFWMHRVRHRDISGSSYEDLDYIAPWILKIVSHVGDLSSSNIAFVFYVYRSYYNCTFIYTFLGIGVTLCLLTCLGHIAADTANGFCLFCYMVIISVLLLIETGISADILLNEDWEKDIPDDPTGRFRDFKQFVEANINIFEWIFLIIFLGQGLSVLLATALRACRPNQFSNYDSDEEFTQPRLPLINNHAQQPAYVIGEPPFANKNETWNTNK